MIIYKTTNLITGKIYIGKDVKNNPSYLGSGVYICRSIKKHGKENFKKEVICECSSKEELNEKEKYWIKTLNSKDHNIGYNFADGGIGGDTYTNNPNRDKIRKKHSEFMRKNNPMKNTETIKKMIQSNAGFKHSEYSKSLIATKKMGKNNPMFGVPPWNKKEQMPPQLCLCGCGEMTKPNMKYIYGHNRRGKIKQKNTYLKKD